MRRRVLEVELHSAYDSLVRGPGAGALIIELTGRPAAYSRQRRGYAVQERTARDAVALAERRGYDVVITGRRAHTPATTASRVVSVVEQPDPGRGLW